MKRPLLILISLLSIQFAVLGQTARIVSGPMPGHSAMRTVKIWLQTDIASDVQIQYWDENNTSEVWTSDIVSTTKEDAFTAHFDLDTEPSKTYNYSVILDNKVVENKETLQFKSQTLWQYRMDPPTFTFGLGSCAYINEAAYDRPSRPYGGDYGIFDVIANERPEFFLWMGDNVYLREPDYDSRIGIIKRYNHVKQLPELQKLWRSTHHYAIWDDHDFGPNDSDRSYLLKNDALDAFKLFWANPSYGLTGDKDGICSNFKWNDCEFFLLDNRYFRSPNRRKYTDHTILGKEQLEWLLDALSYSKASFKFVVIGGQVVNDAAVWENYANTHAKERTYLLESIQKEGIKNVIFLDGDRHHTELSMLSDDKAPVIYDLTVSPLTSGAHDALDEPNSYRVKGTHVAERNYGLIEVSGKRTQRVLKIIIKDKEGSILWEQTINQQ
mgnify:CR=1 FL=1